MTVQPPAERPAPGYYPDPSIPGFVRYWDGDAWTPGSARPAPTDGAPLPPPPRAARGGVRVAPPPPPRPTATDETGPVFLDETGAARLITPPAPEESTAAPVWAASAQAQPDLLDTGSVPRHVTWGVPVAEPAPASPSPSAVCADPDDELAAALRLALAQTRHAQLPPPARYATDAPTGADAGAGAADAGATGAPTDRAFAEPQVPEQPTALPAPHTPERAPRPADAPSPWAGPAWSVTMSTGPTPARLTPDAPSAAGPSEDPATETPWDAGDHFAAAPSGGQSYAPAESELREEPGRAPSRGEGQAAGPFGAQGSVAEAPSGVRDPFAGEPFGGQAYAPGGEPERRDEVGRAPSRGGGQAAGPFGSRGPATEAASGAGDRFAPGSFGGQAYASGQSERWEASGRASSRGEGLAVEPFEGQTRTPGGPEREGRSGGASSGSSQGDAAGGSERREESGRASSGGESHAAATGRQGRPAAESFGARGSAAEAGFGADRDGGRAGGEGGRRDRPAKDLSSREGYDAEVASGRQGRPAAGGGGEPGEAPEAARSGGMPAMQVAGSATRTVVAGTQAEPAAEERAGGSTRTAAVGAAAQPRAGRAASGVGQRRSKGPRPALLGPRIGARLVDTVVSYAVVGVLGVVLVQRVTLHLQAKVDAARASGVPQTVWLVDGTVLADAGLLLAALLVVGVVYETIPVAVWGRTLGKAIFGLTVLDARTRARPRLARTFLRTVLCQTLVFLLLGILELVPCATDRKLRQSWHDKLGGTFVAKR